MLSGAGRGGSGGCFVRRRGSFALPRLAAAACSVAALAGGGVADAAAAEIVRLPALRDATLIESSTGAFANGAGAVLFAGRTSQPRDARRRALLAFDVAAALPPRVVVTSATLTLALSPSNPDPVEMHLHRVLADWGEGASAASGGSGAPAALGDATWLHTFYADAFWADPGGDFAVPASAAATVGEAGVYRWNATPELIADVQAWLDTPSQDFGWILIGDESASSTAKRFYSREHTDASAQPMLEVEYAAPCELLAPDHGARAICHAYCEALDCDAGAPNGAQRACDRLARGFARRSGGAPPPCERAGAAADRGD